MDRFISRMRKAAGQACSALSNRTSWMTSALIADLNASINSFSMDVLLFYQKYEIIARAREIGPSKNTGAVSGRCGTDGNFYKVRNENEMTHTFAGNGVRPL